MDFSINDLDIFGYKVTLYYNQKEKINSLLSLILSLTYFLASIIIFVFSVINAIRRKDLRFYDSVIYLDEVDSVNLTSDILYFSFGVENATEGQNFIDETIYTQKTIYYETIKENGNWITKNKRYLDVKKCKLDNYGKNHQKLFRNNIDTSYCIDDFYNMTLAGGFTLDKFNYIKIKIYPCKNSTDNNYHCKQQSIIDKYLSSTYFSALFQDIGLTPNNYSFPILPITKDIYSSFGKNILREHIIYFKKVNIETDIGLFFNKIKTDSYLMYDSDSSTFLFQDGTEYYKGSSVFNFHIRLSDKIKVQRRTYIKISEIFSTTGGYMQLFFTIFTLISLIPNKFCYEKTLINTFFDLDLTEQKINYNNKKRNVKLRHDRPVSFSLNINNKEQTNKLPNSDINYLSNNENENQKSNILLSDRKGNLMIINPKLINFNNSRRRSILKNDKLFINDLRSKAEINKFDSNMKYISNSKINNINLLSLVQQKKSQLEIKKSKEMIFMMNYLQNQKDNLKLIQKEKIINSYIR